jgi:hypothetical protein
LKSQIENLLDFEAAVKIIMGAAQNVGKIHPLDYCFNALGLRMACLDHENPEFRMIRQYIHRTHPMTTKEQEKFLVNVFAVERKGEAERMQ